jgi:hypothetical protein
LRYRTRSRGRMTGSYMPKSSVATSHAKVELNELKKYFPTNERNIEDMNNLGVRTIGSVRCKDRQTRTLMIFGSHRFYYNEKTDELKEV